MDKKTWFGVSVLFLAVFLAINLTALPFCMGKAKGPSEILLGATLSLSGPAAGFGQGGAFGMKAAVEDINKLGGVFVKEYGRKLPIKLIILDNETDAIKGGTLAQELLVKEKVNFLVSSPMWSPLIAAVATVAERHKTPFVCFAGPFEPNNALREAAGPWKYTWESGFAIGAPPPPGDFRNVPGYTMMGVWLEFLGKYAGKTNKKIAAFASDDPDGRGWYEAFTGALTKAGLEVVGKDKELGIAPGDTTDFTPMIKTWKDADCQLLLGNAPPPWFGTLWRQCKSMDYKPKLVIAERAAMMYTDISSWGGDLPLGVTSLIEWLPTIKAPGIGSTTPKSLDDRWRKATGQPTHQLVGSGYSQIQVYIDAIERAGTLDKDKVNEAIGKTDLMTIRHRIKYDNSQFSRLPICLGQWFKEDTPSKWEMKVIFSQHDFFSATAKPIFPLP